MFKNILVGIDKKLDKYTVYSLEFRRVAVLSEKELIKAIQNGMEFENVAVENNQLKGTSGSLSRFDTKPYVILSRVADHRDTTIGYDISDYSGRVRRVLLKHCLAFARSKTTENEIPFQNAIYVPDTIEKKAHIKSYTGHDFPTVQIKAANNRHSIQQSKAGVVSLVKANFDAISKKMQSEYTKEQLEQLRLGVQHKIAYSLYANKDISAEKMRLMREHMERGYLPTTIAHPSFIIPCSIDCLQYVLAVDAMGRDVRSLLNPKYTVPQMVQINLGLILGLDVNEYADPSLSVQSMEKIRIRMEGKYWSGFEEEV